MRKLRAVAAIGLSVLVLLLPVQSCGVLGGPPGNVRVQADSTEVRGTVIWTAPTKGCRIEQRMYTAPADREGHQG